MPYEITDYSSNDHEAVWVLHQKTIQENEGFVKNLAFHTDFHDILKTYKAFFVVRDGGQVVGMVGLKQIDSQNFEIKRLQVASAHQGKGLGKKLMEHALNYAKKEGAACVCLDVSAKQTKAKKLYSALGFQVTHTEARTLGPDNEKFLSVYMKKDL